MTRIESSEIMIQRNSLPTPMMPPILVNRVRLPLIINVSISDYNQELTDGQVGSGLLHLSVESHKQPVSVISGVKTSSRDEDILCQ